MCWIYNHRQQSLEDFVAWHCPTCWILYYASRTINLSLCVYLWKLKKYILNYVCHKLKITINIKNKIFIFQIRLEALKTQNIVNIVNAENWGGDSKVEKIKPNKRIKGPNL